MSSIIIYNIFCNENTIPILSDQINKIVFTGLYDNVEFIYCFFIGENNFIIEAKKYIQKSGKKFKFADTYICDFFDESHCLIQMKKYLVTDASATSNPRHFLYIHTFIKDITNLFLQEERTLTEYYLMTKHKDCIQLLEKFDTVGINLLSASPLEYYYYSIHYWWCRVDYYLTLSSEVSTQYPPNYYLLSNLDKVRIYHFINTNVSHETTEYPFYKYIDSYIYHEPIYVSKTNVNNIKIVIARYNENIDWVLPFSNVVIYNKGEKLDSKYKNVTYLKNVGREGHTFYQHIYENYDCLSDYTMFLQGNPFDHMPHIITVMHYLNETKIDIDFAFISENILKTNLIKCPYHIGHNGIIPLNRVFYELFGYYKPDLEYEFGPGNQFIVSKKAIHKKPRDFYLKIVKMLEYDNCPIEGYVIERFQSLIFNYKHSNVCHERTIAISYFLNQCSIKYNNEHICQIPFNTFDRGEDYLVTNNNGDSTKRGYSMCYNKNSPELEAFCIPDCFFHSWPSANIASFDGIKQQLIEASGMEPIIPKVGWVGNIYSPLSDVIEYTTRPLLKTIGDANPTLFDIIQVLPVDFVINENSNHYMSLPDLVRKYKYLIDIGGNGWSGRLKFLLFSKRPLLIVDRVYIEYFYNDLIPYVHYIPVKADLSDLIIQTHWMLANEDKCNEIANNAFNYAIENFTLDKFLDRVYYAYCNIVSK
uniref:Glycosyl transferase CAP10 domain-containing protein n=1 Tax=viral metagenome TaxID=1070528 RepID=A0A6C0DRL2_9ZZZZ